MNALERLRRARAEAEADNTADNPTYPTEQDVPTYAQDDLLQPEVRACLLKTRAQRLRANMATASRKGKDKLPQESEPTPADVSQEPDPQDEPAPVITLETLRSEHVQRQAELSALLNEQATVQMQLKQAIESPDLDPQLILGLRQRNEQIKVSLTTAKLLERDAQATLYLGLAQTDDWQLETLVPERDAAQTQAFQATARYENLRAEVGELQLSAHDYRTSANRCLREAQSLRSEFAKSLAGDGLHAPTQPREDLNEAVRRELASVGKTMTGASI